MSIKLSYLLNIHSAFVYLCKNNPLKNYNKYVNPLFDSCKKTKLWNTLINMAFQSFFNF